MSAKRAPKFIGVPERVPAVMADGSGRCKALLVGGYVKPERGQDFLEKIKNECPVSVETRVETQVILLEIISVLNARFNDKPSKEEWDALNYLFKSVLGNLPSMTGFRSEEQTDTADSSV